LNVKSKSAVTQDAIKKRFRLALEDGNAAFTSSDKNQPLAGDKEKRISQPWL
jgi:hypothetical protein